VMAGVAVCPHWPAIDVDRPQTQRASQSGPRAGDVRGSAT
jgi:hypothetical protein